MSKSDDFNSARADVDPNRASSGQARNCHFPAVSGKTGNSGGASLPFRQKLPGYQHPGQLGCPGCPDPGSGWPGSGVWDARIRGLDGPDPGSGRPGSGSQGLPGGPGRASWDPPGLLGQPGPSQLGPGCYPTLPPDRPGSIRTTGLDRPKMW